MCAIVGPSGAGKSTLLEILSGFRPAGKIDGAIWMNGRPVGKRFRRVSAFVNQSDMFVPTMSALETLQFHARLRIGGRRSAADVEERMRMVLETMGLWRSRNTQVGGTLPGGISVRGLSGGEKRTVALASVLALNPDAICLDEPMGGLDPRTKNTLRDLIQSLNASGKTILCATHDFEYVQGIFERAIVLSKEGRVVRDGPYTEVMADRAFLESQNIV